MGTTKRALIVRTADRLGCKQDLTKQVIQMFLDGMVGELALGNKLEFREFGIFTVRGRKSRIARNPQTGEAVAVPAKATVHFKPGRVMKAKVLGLDIAAETSASDSEVDA